MTVNDVISLIAACTSLIIALTGLLATLIAISHIRQVKNQVTPSNGTKLADIVEKINTQTVDEGTQGVLKSDLPDQRKGVTSGQNDHH